MPTVAKRLAGEAKAVDYLRPYRWLGLTLDEGHGEQAVGDCPFCGKERKLSVNATNGKWRCWVCGVGTERGGGNLFTFIRLLHERSNSEGALILSKADRSSLAASRGLLDLETLTSWGACRSVVSLEWILPGRSSDGSICTIYRWAEVNGKRLLLACPTLHHGLFTAGFDEGKPGVYVCEGPWDAMALWEVLAKAKETDAGIAFTGTEAASLLASANVVATPGANVWRDEWTKMLAGKVVTLCFDSDHPREAPKGSGRFAQAGFDGMRRIAERLAGVASEVRVLIWGPQGYDENLKSGFDVRDWLTGDDS